MILNKEKEIEYKSNSIFEGHDAKISEEDLHKLWSMLQDPYKNSIGAIVREITSNCFDSHSEAGVKEAVHVKIGKDDTGWYWSAEDFGVGISPERMSDIYISYLKSTKENSNNQIGCFGLGSKSPLSYTDLFHIRTRYNGIEYSYILRKGEKTPRLEKLFEEPTTERNGTLIKIYIKNGKKYSYSNLEPEIWRFKEECQKQLCYFENVYFEGCDINNDYKILEGKYWKKNYGKHGTKDRDSLEAGYEAFKIGSLIHDTRVEMGMTQEQLAEKVGTSKSYISKIENNIKEARISTLQKIIELGFGGQLELNIKI